MKKLLTFFGILGIVLQAFPQKAIFLPLTKLQIENGLPGINVRKITKDRLGFMWFATQDGLSRFDGRSYINLNSYNVDKKRKLLGTDIYDIKPDLAGSFLWALSSYGGLNKINVATGDIASTYQINITGEKTTLWYKCFAENLRYLFIGTNEGIICRFDKSLNRIDSTFSLSKKFNCSGQLDDLWIDAYNRVWYMISGKGILVTDQHFNRRIRFINSSTFDTRPFSFTDCAPVKNLLFLTTTCGLKAVDMTTLLPVFPSKEENPFIAYCSGKELHSISTGGGVVIVSGKNILYKLDSTSGRYESIQLAGDYENRSWLTLTNTVFAGEKNIWIGSPYGVGWIKNVSSPFTPYYNSFDGKNIKIKHAITLCSMDDSLLLVCGDDGLYRLNVLTSIINKFEVEDFYYSVFPVSADYFIASGVSHGLQLFDWAFRPLNISAVFPELKSIRQDLIMCSTQMGDSIVFMASQNKNGLYIWNKITKCIDTINTRSGGLSLRNDNINRLYLDSKHRLWIVCENVVSVYDPVRKTIEHLALEDPSTHLPLSINMDVCEAANKYWILSYGTGIVKLSDDFRIEKVFTARNEIPNLGLYKIFSLSDSLLICSSNAGLAVLNINTEKIKTYSIEDGLQSNSFEEASGDKRGASILFGGINGVTKIDVSKITAHLTAPDLTFSTITLTSPNAETDTLNYDIRLLRIPSSVVQFRIGFSAIDYTAPDKVKFAYRILEKDTNWSYTKQNFFQSFRIDAGTYTLQVKAVNEGSLWSQVKELKLDFLPKWYEYWFIKPFLFAIALVILYALYKTRINQLKKEQKIRSGIASDLHDDLGSTLNSVKAYANLEIMEKGADTNLVKIKQSIQEAISSLRDTIWVMDDKKGTVEHLLFRINQFSEPLCTAYNISFHATIADDAKDYTLSASEKRNIYLILKEAVNNTIKYAQAVEVALEISFIKSRLSILIRDNGKGFDPASITEGNGLNNMKVRAMQINFSISIAAGLGTTIRLTRN